MDIILTHTPSSRGGFNRSVTRMSVEISPGPYHMFIGRWTRSSSLLPMTIHGTVLLGPVKCFHVAVFELSYSSHILSFPRCPEPYISHKSKCLTARARVQKTVHIIHNYEGVQNTKMKKLRNKNDVASRRKIRCVVRDCPIQVSTQHAQKVCRAREKVPRGVRNHAT